MNAPKVINIGVKNTSINFSPTISGDSTLKVSNVHAGSGSSIDFSPTMTGDSHLTVHDVTSTKGHNVKFTPYVCNDTDIELGNVHRDVKGDYCYCIYAPPAKITIPKNASAAKKTATAVKILLNLAIATTDDKTELTNVCSSDENSIKAAAKRIAKGTLHLPTKAIPAVTGSPSAKPGAVSQTPAAKPTKSTHSGATYITASATIATTLFIMA